MSLSLGLRLFLWNGPPKCKCRLCRPQSDSCDVCVFAYVFVHRPNKENTGEVSESGASLVKHALNPEKPFMQVHYLKVRLIAQSADSSGTSSGLCRVALSLFLSFSGLLPLEVSGWSGWRREVPALLQSVCGKIPRTAHSVSGECVLHRSGVLIFSLNTKVAFNLAVIPSACIRESMHHFP